MGVRGINAYRLEACAILPVDHDRGEQVGRRRTLLGRGDHGKAVDLGADRRLAGRVEIEGGQVFGRDGQSVSRVDSENRQGQKAEAGLTCALEEHQRSLGRRLNHQKLEFLFKRRQAGGEPDNVTFLVFERPEILRQDLGHFYRDYNSDCSNGSPNS